MKKKLLKGLFVLGLFVLMSMLSANTFAAEKKGMSLAKGKAPYRATVTQNAINSKIVKVKLQNIKTLKKQGITKVRFQMYMKYKGKVTTRKLVTKKLSAIKTNTATLSFYAPAYGKYDASIRYYDKKGKVSKMLTYKNFGIVADEYNIACMTATMGPLLYTSSFWDHNQTEDGTPIPTVIQLTRYDSYNWDKLPKNTTWNPLLGTYKEASYTKNFNAAYQYVAELRSLNKESKFHFYLTDFSCKAIMDLADYNGLTDDQYDVNLYSDGSGSYKYFNETFNVENPTAVYKKMVRAWWIARSKYQDGKKYDVSTMYMGSGTTGSQALRPYALIAAQESENISWHVLRKDGTFLCEADADFLTDAKAAMTQDNLKDKLTDLQTRGLDDDFKDLYRFDSEMFAEAEESGKQVMVLMGSKLTAETQFEEFASFVMEYYGDDYMYYYKGHPATPTDLSAEKQKQLEDLGITDIESSIPAELILFFCPDIYVSGESNSTLNESYVEGHTKAYKGTRIANKASITSGDKFEMFFTKITSNYETAITDLCGGDLTDLFLVEFVDTSQHDIAIYDHSDKTITYYVKQGDGSYIAEN